MSSKKPNLAVFGQVIEVVDTSVAPPWANELADFANRVAETTGYRLTEIRVGGSVPRTYRIATATGLVDVVEGIAKRIR